MKTLLSIALGGIAALSSAQTISLASPKDWQFDYAGKYAFTAASGSGNLSSLLGSAVGAQLKLFQGNVSASQTASLTQSGSAIRTSDLDFKATAPSGLLNGLGAFLTNVLNSADGPYSGTLTGTSLALHGPSFATIKGQVDARAAGTGALFDLSASLVSSSLTGTVDGVHGGVGDHVRGTAGKSDTLAISLGQRTYVGGFLTSTIAPIQVGVIDFTADSWSLSRPQAQPVPEPGTMAAVGLGLLAVARRRRKAA